MRPIDSTTFADSTTRSTALTVRARPGAGEHASADVMQMSSVAISQAAVVDLGDGARKATESQQLAQGFYTRPTPAGGIPKVIVPPPARLPSIPGAGDALTAVSGTAGVATTDAAIGVTGAAATEALAAATPSSARATVPATPHATAAASNAATSSAATVTPTTTAATSSAATAAPPTTAAAPTGTAATDDAANAARAAEKANQTNDVSPDTVVAAAASGAYKILRGEGGVEYAVSGQVMVTSGSIRNDPEGAIRELTAIREQALIPPTTFQDLQLAARAALDVQRAQIELARKRYSDHQTPETEPATTRARA